MAMAGTAAAARSVQTMSRRCEVNFVAMAEKDMEKAINIGEAIIACGGGTVTDESRQQLKDVMAGKLTVDDAVAQIKREYGAAGT